MGIRHGDFPLTGLFELCQCIDHREPGAVAKLRAFFPPFSHLLLLYYFSLFLILNPLTLRCGASQVAQH